MPELRVITFDLDNTLWDVHSVIVNAERAMRAYLEQDAPDVVALFERGETMDIRERVIAEDATLKHDISTLRERVVMEALLATGMSQTRSAAVARQAFDVFLEARHDVTYFEHALETLEALSARYVMGALSNGNADTTTLGLDRFLTFSFSAAAVGASKPAPDMFHAALEHTGAAPEEAVHIGDHLVDDIAGATAVGMHTIWVNLGRQPLEGEVSPSGEVTALDQLVDAITAIEAR